MRTPAHEDMSQTIGTRHRLLFAALYAAQVLVLITLWQLHTATPEGLRRTTRPNPVRVIIAAGSPALGQAAVGVEIIGIVLRARYSAAQRHVGCSLQYK